MGTIAFCGLALLMLAAAPAAAAPGTWSLATTRPAAAAAAPAYLGNGYVGTRIPADGAGYASSPVASETHIAGVYASIPDEVGGGIQRQGSINLPGWTQLDVVVAGRRYSSANARSYRQVIDLRRGVVTTRATWSAGGRVTDIRYDVVLDRARKRVGLVRLRLVPRWSGRLRVRDVLGAGAYRQSLRRVRVTSDDEAALVAVRAAGTGTTAAQAARLRVPASSSVGARERPRTLSTIRTATIPRAGRS